MELNEQAIADWINRLKLDGEATVTVPPGATPFNVVKQPATWRLGIYATAFFYIPEAARQPLAQGIPALHARFQALTDHPLTSYQNGKTGSVSKQYTQEKLEADFLAAMDGGVGTLVGYDGGTKESSPRFAMNAVLDFDPATRPGGDLQMLSYLTVRLPLSFWQTRRQDFLLWWLDALNLLAPEQAYLGLSLANPPILERWPFVEPAELALAKAFYGLEIDKPFFMGSSERDGMHLESGQRTPAYGVLLHGQALERLGGKAAVQRHLTALSPDFRLTPCLDGWWVEAGSEPKLYPVEAGIPTLPAALAALTRPLRLDCLRLVSYNPNIPDDRRFTPETARRWLKRFDDDGDWPSPEVRFKAPTTPLMDTTSTNLTAHPGEPCPETGDWYAVNLGGKTVFVQKGEPMPGPNLGPGGEVIWHLRKPGP